MASFHRAGSRRRARHGAWVLTASLLVGTLGCGGGTGTVSGKVIYKGQPLPGGIVTFLTKDNHSVSATIQEDGTYEITKVPTGSVTICVETESLNPVMPPAQAGMGVRKEQGFIMPESMRGRVPKEMARPEEPPLTGKYVKIPKKFTDPEQSGLTYVVQRGKQVHDIELK